MAIFFMRDFWLLYGPIKITFFYLVIRALFLLGEMKGRHPLHAKSKAGATKRFFPGRDERLLRIKRGGHAK
jgi:hypothetical protein